MKENYRKPTHTDQYLAYDSHHPQSVKRGIVKCLYERAKRLVTKPSIISEEKKKTCHLFWFLMVILFLSYKNLPRPENQTTGRTRRRTPYVEGLSELLRRCLQQQGVRAVFKSETSLRSQLARPKDAVFFCKKENSALLEHTCLTNHTIGWDNSKIITTNRRYHQRLCLEANLSRSFKS